MRATNVLFDSRHETSPGGVYTSWVSRGEPEVRPSQQGATSFQFFPPPDDSTNIEVRASTRVSNGNHGPYSTSNVTYIAPPP